MPQVIQVFSSDKPNQAPYTLPNSITTRGPDSLRQLVESLDDGLTLYSLFALAGLAVANACDGVEIFSIGYMISVLTNEDQTESDGRLFPMKRLVMSSTTAATFSALMFVGMMSGGLITGPLATRFGRRIPLLLCILLIFMSYVVSCQSPDLYTLIASKLVTGLGIGMTTPLIFATASELFPSPQLGFTVSCLGLCWIAGAMYASGLGYLLLSYWNFSWRAYSFACSMPSLCALILCTIFVDESPYFVLERGTSQQATRTVRRFTGLGVTSRLLRLIRRLFSSSAPPQLHIQESPPSAAPLLGLGDHPGPSSPSALTAPSNVQGSIRYFPSEHELSNHLELLNISQYVIDVPNRGYSDDDRSDQSRLELWSVDRLNDLQCQSLLAFIELQWRAQGQSGTPPSSPSSPSSSSSSSSSSHGDIPQIAANDGDYANASHDKPSHQADEEGSTPIAHDSPSSMPSSETYSLILLLLLSCIWFIVSFASAGFSVWLPKLLSKVFAKSSGDGDTNDDDDDGDAAAYITTFIYSSIQVPACFCVMFLISRCYNPRFLLVCLTGCFACIVTLIALYNQSYPAVVFVCCYQLFMTMIWTILNSVSLSYFPAKSRTFAFAIQNSSGKTGAIAAQYLFGMLVENHTRVLFVIVSTFFLLALLVCMVFEKRARVIDKLLPPPSPQPSE